MIFYDFYSLQNGIWWHAFESDTAYLIDGYGSNID